MAQSSNALREPSMEEILASIRRIIEESDTVQPPETASVPISEASFETSAAVSTVASIASAPYPVQSAVDEVELDTVEPVSGHFVAAQPSPAPAAPVAFPSYADETDEFSSATSEPITLSPIDLQPEELTVDTPLIEDVIAAPDLPVTPAPSAEKLDGANMNVQPMLSEVTEKQVAAAFQDLSFAVLEEQRQSYDEMAREMLRPMLQDWLDNNLPTMVERLVREEIERVARGGRR